MIYKPISVKVLNEPPLNANVIHYVQKNYMGLYNFELEGVVWPLTEEEMEEKYIEMTNGEDHF